jgi:endonuclease/exonuclease/phosphatase family metal-dependent hydrolase
MSVEIITYNIQRDYSWKVVPVLRLLRWENPNAFICLQEVPDTVWKIIAKDVSRTVHMDENMIIFPEGSHVENSRAISFGRKTRSFLHADISQWDVSFSLLTGKLRHGISALERYQTLQKILEYFSDCPSLLALDTNHTIPGESRIVLWLLSKYGFNSTDHPSGTYDMRRSEHTILQKVPRFFARLQLDRIFASSLWQLWESRVRTDIRHSDHEPVGAKLSHK